MSQSTLKDLQQVSRLAVVGGARGLGTATISFPCSLPCPFSFIAERIIRVALVDGRQADPQHPRCCRLSAGAGSKAGLSVVGARYSWVTDLYASFTAFPHLFPSA